MQLKDNRIHLSCRRSPVFTFSLSLRMSSCLSLSTCFQPFQSFQSTEKVQDRMGACGDGKVQPQHGEECDDGNQIVTDACLST